MPGDRKLQVFMESCLWFGGWSSAGDKERPAGNARSHDVHVLGKQNDEEREAKAWPPYSLVKKDELTRFDNDTRHCLSLSPSITTKLFL
jgi:hypothetical protein